MKGKRSVPKATVDDQANDNSMHEMGFGKTNPLSDQSAAPGTQRKMIALNALCIPFPGNDGTPSYALLICVIAISIDCINMKRCQQGSQLVQVFMFTRTKTVSQRFTGTMVYCPPQPILLRFVMDKGPHLIHFRTFKVNLFRRYDVNFCYLMLLDIFLIDLPGPIFCFFKIEVTESFEIPNIRPVARVPVQSAANLRTCSLTFGS